MNVAVRVQHLAMTIGMKLGELRARIAAMESFWSLTRVALLRRLH